MASGIAEYRSPSSRFALRGQSSVIRQTLSFVPANFYLPDISIVPITSRGQRLFHTSNSGDSALFFVHIYHFQTPSSLRTLSIVLSHLCIHSQSSTNYSLSLRTRRIKIPNRYSTHHKPNPTKQHENHRHLFRPRGALRLHGRRRRQSELHGRVRIHVSTSQQISPPFWNET